MAEHATQPTSDFTKRGISKGLTKVTLQELSDNGYGCLAALKDISEDTVKSLQISSAQRSRLRRFLEELRVPNDQTDASPQNESLPAPPRGFHSVSPRSPRTENPDKSGKEVPKKRQLILRPHEIVYHRDTDFLEFLYANLLALEKMHEQDSESTIPFLRHLHYVSLKVMQQYSLQEILAYDTEVRDTLDNEGGCWADVRDLNIAPKYFPPDRIAKWKKMRRIAASSGKAGTFRTDRCMSWNYSRDGTGCIYGNTCKFQHVCLLCGADHTINKCQVNIDRKKRQTATSKEGQVYARLAARS